MLVVGAVIILFGGPDAFASYPQTMTTTSPHVNLHRPDDDPRWAKAFAHWDKRGETEEVDAALLILEEIAKDKPDSFEAQLWLCRVYYHMAVRKRGDKYFSKKGVAAGDAALKIKPGDDAATVWRFSSLLLSRDFTEDEYKDVEALGARYRSIRPLPEPDYDPLWAEAIKKYDARMDREQALAAICDFEKLDAKYPNRIEAKLYLSWSYYYLGLAEPDKEEKAEFFKTGADWGRKAINVEPRNPAANYFFNANLGSYTEQAGMFAMVRHSMELTEALILVCEEDPTYMYGGFSRYMAASLAKAGELSFRVAEMLGFSKELLVRLSVYSTRQEPGYFDNHFRLAQMYLTLGREEEAKKALEFVINADPAMLKYYEPENMVIQKQAKELYDEHFK
jgi:hypothetical protein